MVARKAVPAKPKEGSVSVPHGTALTDPLRRFLVDLHDAIGRFIGSTPLTTGDTTAPDDEPPWDEGPPAPAADPEPEPAKPAAKKTTARKVATKAAEPEPQEPAEAEELTAEQYEAQLRAMSLEEVQALVIALDYEPASVKATGLDDLIAALIEDFNSTPGEPEPEADPDDLPAADDDDLEGTPVVASNQVTREELLEMNLPALRQLAGSLEIPVAQYKALDIEAIAELIMSYQEHGLEGDAAAEEPAEGEAEESEFYTEADYRAMSRADLWTLATTAAPDGFGYNPPKAISQDDLISLLVNGPTDEVPGF